MKSEGLSFLDEEGFVEMWMGICHGWSPAAYMYKRPIRPLTLTAADGATKITFQQDDIKALASLKWARSLYNSRYVGGRCNAKGADIEKDEKTGKILNYNCFDTNPGTWHVVMANKIGIQDESFVMDATFDYEVWNQPVYSYKVTFFNVKTMKSTMRIDRAAVKLSELGESDPFYGVRKADPRATQLVGVKMSMMYVAETHPRHGEPHKDRLVRVEYHYDLELDDNFNIVGGEWYTNKHPDFLWTPIRGQQPLNNIDRRIVTPLKDLPFDGDMAKIDQTLGNPLSRVSQMSVKFDNSPLKYVIDGLVDMSSTPSSEEEENKPRRRRRRFWRW